MREIIPTRTHATTTTHTEQNTHSGAAEEQGRTRDEKRRCVGNRAMLGLSLERAHQENRLPSGCPSHRADVDGVGHERALFRDAVEFLWCLGARTWEHWRRGRIRRTCPADGASLDDLRQAANDRGLQIGSV